MTYDEMIAAGCWEGPILDLRRRMSNYLVDGKRFGGLDLTTKSGSANDTSLEKRMSEINIASMVLSQAGFDGVKITSVDALGKPLERSDLDAEFQDGAVVGLEIAEVVETDVAKHNASHNAIEQRIADRLDADPAFGTAFGNMYLSITLNPPGPPSRAGVLAKKLATAILDEIEDFVQRGLHATTVALHFHEFPEEYAILRARGALFSAEPSDAPHFSLSDGATTIGRQDRKSEVLRVLDKHRVQAVGYRQPTNWMLMLLSDAFEFFYDTVGAVALLKPPIAPFERAYLADPVLRLLRLDHNIDGT